VILRSVTSVAHAKQEVEGEYNYAPMDRKAEFEKNIFRYTKAGSAICIAQHEDLLDRLQVAEQAVDEAGINRMQEATDHNGLFVVAAGALIPYVREVLSSGEHQNLSTLFLESVHPLDRQLAGRLFQSAKTVLVLEELEPFVEMQLRSEASRLGWGGTILGKLDSLLPRVGKYSQEVIGRGLKTLVGSQRGRGAAITRPLASSERDSNEDAQPASDRPATVQPAVATLTVKHPITFCAGCPHRGTFMAINRALKEIGLNRDNTVVTGDIGCTILGMNPHDRLSGQPGHRRAIPGQGSPEGGDRGNRPGNGCGKPSSDRTLRPGTSGREHRAGPAEGGSQGDYFSSGVCSDRSSSGGAYPDLSDRFREMYLLPLLPAGDRLSRPVCHGQRKEIKTRSGYGDRS